MSSQSLQSFTELKKNSGHSSLALLLIALASITGMSLYVFLKQFLEPNLTVLKLDVVTVACGSLVSTAVAYFVLRRNRLLHQRAAAELSERQWTEEALSESEARYRQLFERNPQPMWVYDLETLEFLAVNESAVRHYGYSHEEFALMSVRDIRLPEKQIDADATVKSLSPGYHTPRVWKHRKKNGMPIDVEISSHTLDFGGRRANLVLVHDVTEVKRVERILIESEAELRIMFGAMSDIILVFDVDGRYLKIAPTNSKSRYKSPAELLGKTVDEIFPAAQAEFFMRHIRLALERKQMLNVEYKLQIGGRTVWFEGRVSPMSNDTVFWISRDITERKQIEERMRESEKNYRELFENAIDIVYTTDLKGDFTSLNKTGETLTGYSREEVPRINFAQVVAPEYLEIARQNLHKKISGAATAAVYEMDILAKDGRRIQVEASTRLIERDGVPIGIQGISRDITERKQLEEQLRQAQKLESVGQLAAGIAHEINTPLQYVGDNTRFLQDAFRDLTIALESHTELLAACRAGRVVDAGLIAAVDAALQASEIEYLSAEIPAALQQSLSGIERVTRIVQSMKDFAHPGSSEMKAVNLNKSIESTVTVASNEWKYIAELETDYDETLPPVVCMSGEINQVVLNLIINAVHAIADVVGDGSGGKGRIVISTRKLEVADNPNTNTEQEERAREEQQQVEIRISDTGGGIREEIREQIFNPFFTTKEVGRGTGQGLAISHRVASKHGGTLLFETEIGRGTTFILRLPINGAQRAN